MCSQYPQYLRIELKKLLLGSGVNKDCCYCGDQSVVYHAKLNV